MAAAPLESVWDNLVAALEGIKTGSTYRTTVYTVTTDPVGLLGVSPQQTPYVQLLWDAERSRLAASAFGLTDDELVFTLEWRLDCPSLTPADRRQAISDWVTDLEHAVMADISRGSAAWDTTIAHGPGGPWVDVNGTILGASTITVRVSRTTGAA